MTSLASEEDPMPEYGDPELQAEMDEAPVASNARDWVVKTGDQWDEKGAEEEGVTIDVHPCNRPAKVQHLPRNYKDMDALGKCELAKVKQLMGSRPPRPASILPRSVTISRRKLGKGTGGALAREEVPCPEAMLRYNRIYKCVDQFDFLLTARTWDMEGWTIFHKWYCRWALGLFSTIVRMAYCLQKLALGKDAMDHKVFILAFHTQLLKNTFDGTPRLRGMAVPSIGKGRAGRHSGTVTGPTQAGGAHPHLVHARSATWPCARQTASTDFHNPLMIKLPYIDTAPVAKKLLAGVVLTSTRTGGRKEYKKKAQC
eukprot:jgi/Mesvir1/16141/Mv08415-RA.1